MVHVWFDFCLHAKNEPTKRVNVKTLFIFTSVLNLGSKLHHSVSVKLMNLTTSTKGRFIFSSLKIFKHFWGGFGIMYKIKLHWKLCLPIRQTCKTCFTTKELFKLVELSFKPLVSSVCLLLSSTFGLFCQDVSPGLLKDTSTSRKKPGQTQHTCISSKRKLGMLGHEVRTTSSTSNATAQIMNCCIAGDIKSAVLLRYRSHSAARKRPLICH